MEKVNNTEINIDFDIEILSTIVRDRCLYGDDISKINILEIIKHSNRTEINFEVESVILVYTFTNHELSILYRNKAINLIIE